MTIQLDHLLVPAADAAAAAARLADLLGVPWGKARAGPFVAVYVSASLTIDFDTCEGTLPKGHYAFHVTDAAFDGLLGRIQAAGLAFRSTPHGPDDHAVNTSLGGRIVYWSEPDGHVWEMLTRSYARPPLPPGPA